MRIGSVGGGSTARALTCSASFKQSFLYDRYGNRTIDPANTDAIGGGVTRLDFKALTANNRLVAQTDVTGDDPGSDLMRYDKAGNLVWDNFSPVSSQRGSMTYDAENRMVTAVSGTQRYRYDANGRRVKRLVGQTGANGEVWQVYSPEGELLAEYPKQGAASVPTKEYGYRNGQLLVVFDSTEAAADDKLKWLVQDHLGSTRMVIDKSGSLAGVKRTDYLPFGEEIPAGVGIRTASNGYVASQVRQKFGSKERDSETGLDFFEARYFSSVQGRFTSTDPIYYQVMMAIDPQRFNLYAYARNNPLKFVDPDGERVYVRGDLDFLRTEVLYGYAGGQETFDQYFQITNGQVTLREGVDISKANAGVQELAGLVNATENGFVARIWNYKVTMLFCFRFFGACTLHL